MPSWIKATDRLPKDAFIGNPDYIIVRHSNGTEELMWADGKWFRNMGSMGVHELRLKGEYTWLDESDIDNSM